MNYVYALIALAIVVAIYFGVGYFNARRNARKRGAALTSYLTQPWPALLPSEKNEVAAYFLSGAQKPIPAAVFHYIVMEKLNRLTQPLKLMETWIDEGAPLDIITPEDIDTLIEAWHWKSLEALLNVGLELTPKQEFQVVVNGPKRLGHLLMHHTPQLHTA